VKLKIQRMRAHLTPRVPVGAPIDPLEPCPYTGGPYDTAFTPCLLDARTHYHLTVYPTGQVLAIRFGSDADKAAYPPGGIQSHYGAAR
jgi:hypothetical protein